MTIKNKGYCGPERHAYFVECDSREDLNRALNDGLASHFTREGTHEQVATPLADVPDNSLIVLYRDCVQVRAERLDGTRDRRPYWSPLPFAVGHWDAAKGKVNWRGDNYEQNR